MGISLDRAGRLRKVSDPNPTPKDLANLTEADYLVASSREHQPDIPAEVVFAEFGIDFNLLVEERRRKRSAAKRP